MASRPQLHEQLRKSLSAWAKARKLSEEQMVERLVGDPALLMSLIGEVTISESYFFRLQAHYPIVVAAARLALARPENRYCVWSAGCAGGEEPYSIALALRAELTSAELARVTITGTDIDRSGIDSAEAGLYGAWAFRGVDPVWFARGFISLPDGRYEVLPEVRTRVSFRHATLGDYLDLLQPASLDAIFYRNVSVYLTEEANQTLYDGFARVLRPSGLLFLAPTDIRPRSEELTSIQSQDCTVFERILPHSAKTRKIVDPTSSIEAEGLRSPPHKPPESSAPTTASRREQAGGTADPWRPIDELADRGEITAALSLLEARAATEGGTVDFYQRRGRLYLARGDAAASVADFRRVLYLAPDNHPARYWYALALRQSGHSDAARHQLTLIIGARPACDPRLRDSAACLIGELG